MGRVVLVTVWVMPVAEVAAAVVATTCAPKKPRVNLAAEPLDATHRPANHQRQSYTGNIAASRRATGSD